VENLTGYDFFLENLGDMKRSLINPNYLYGAYADTHGIIKME